MSFTNDCYLWTETFHLTAQFGKEILSAPKTKNKNLDSWHSDHANLTTWKLPMCLIFIVSEKIGQFSKFSTWKFALSIFLWRWRFATFFISTVKFGCFVEVYNLKKFLSTNKFVVFIGLFYELDVIFVFTSLTT